jgi:hypothetical protein
LNKKSHRAITDGSNRTDRKFYTMDTNTTASDNQESHKILSKLIDAVISVPKSSKISTGFTMHPNITYVSFYISKATYTANVMEDLGIVQLFSHHFYYSPQYFDDSNEAFIRRLTEDVQSCLAAIKKYCHGR